LVGAKEKQLVFNDGTAHGAAELIEVKRNSGYAFLIQEVVVRIEIVVAVILPNAAVYAVGTRFRDQVINGTSAASILSRQVQRQLLELLHRVLNGNVIGAPTDVLVRDTVDEEAIEILTHTIHHRA
jgi:hypothetical protein